MSSFVRRIERQVHPSKAIHPKIDLKTGKLLGYITMPPRKVHYMGRGKWLGLTNPKAKDLLARQRREEKRRALPTT